LALPNPRARSDLRLKSRPGPAIIVRVIFNAMLDDRILDPSMLDHSMDDDDVDDVDEELPYISGSGEGLMEESTHTGHGNSRRNEDIALDLMKFVAMTTGYGRTTSSGVGFQGSGSAAKPEEYAAHLLELYGKCRSAVDGKK
jgi:hypothetical protein